MRIEQYSTTLSGGNGSDIELHSTITGRTLVSTERYYYDSANRATRIIRQDADGDSYECRWEYDHNNNVTNLVEIVNGQTHTSAYTYDLEQRISQFVNDGVTSGYTYDGFGRLSTQTNGTLNKAYTFYNVQREEVQEDGSTRNVTYATSQIHTLTLDAANYDRTYTYTYDANGNILSVSDGTNTTSYVYDSLNQLVRENNQAAGKTWVYTYDNGGNILSKQEYGYSTGDLDPNDAVVKNYTYGDAHWGDLLTAYNGVTITHDEIGTPLNDGTRTYTWENGRQLAAMECDSVEWTFKYNADGLRTERSNGTVTYDYIYSGSQLIQMTVGNKVFYFTYDAAGTPMTVTYSGTKYFYATNLQGDVIAILDTNGNAVVEYTYDAWGNPLSTTGTMTTLGLLNPLRYRGYVFDSETALYYLQSRYYDPKIGRFLNADSLVSTGQGVLGFNMFAYCGNDPINHIDPTGDLWRVIIPIIIGLIPTLSGCSSPNDDAPEGYVQENSKYQNCYSYAFGLSEGGYPGMYSIPDDSPYDYMLGDPNRETYIYTPEEITNYVLRDMAELGIAVRKVNSPSERLDGEYIVAMKTSTDYVPGYFFADVHFAVLLNNGMWADKQGMEPSRWGIVDGSASTWDIIAGDGYYNTETVYFAVGGRK